MFTMSQNSRQIAFPSLVSKVKWCISCSQTQTSESFSRFTLVWIFPRPSHLLRTVIETACDPKPSPIRFSYINTTYCWSPEPYFQTGVDRADDDASTSTVPSCNTDIGVCTYKALFQQHTILIPVSGRRVQVFFLGRLCAMQCIHTCFCTEKYNTLYSPSRALLSDNSATNGLATCDGFQLLQIS